MLMLTRFLSPISVMLCLMYISCPLYLFFLIEHVRLIICPLTLYLTAHRLHPPIEHVRLIFCPLSIPLAAHKLHPPPAAPPQFRKATP